jgi:DNA-binding NtrC family response regulator
MGVAGGSDTELAGAATAQPPSMAEVEADAIRRALRFAGGNRVKAAEILQIHRNTLAKKIQEYGIEV